MSARQVVPGLYRIPIRLGPMTWVSAYLIAGEELVLVDTGLPKRAKLFVRALSSLGRRPFDIRHILITHHHVDHTGSLAELGQRTEARIYVHPLDAPITRGDEPVPGPSKDTFGARMMGSLSRLLYPTRLPHVSIGHELQDGEQLAIAGGLRVIHTPGHTRGHVSFLWPERRVLFVGDAAAGIGRRVAPPFGAFTEDDDDMKKSIAKLAELDFEVAVFGHGGPIRRGAVAKFRKTVEKLAR